MLVAAEDTLVDHGDQEQWGANVAVPRSGLSPVDIAAAGRGPPTRRHGRNFFAHNVTFARAAFVRGGGYPTVAGTFHGLCQLLSLELASGNTAILLARDVRVTHVWTPSARA